MKILNTTIGAVLLAFLVGFSSGALGVFFGMRDGGENIEIHATREYKISNSIIAGEFDILSESPLIQLSVERLVMGYVGLLDVVVKTLLADDQRLMAIEKLGKMMLVVSVKMAEVVTNLQSRGNRDNRSAEEADPEYRKRLI